MKLIFVAGSWGSGTTAIIGALDALGVPTLGPHAHTNDPRTKNTYELISFREVINAYVDEAAIRHRPNYRTGFIPALQQYKRMLEEKLVNSSMDNSNLLALKMPLASICLPDICKVFDTRVIVSHRPLQQIENSMLRRQWSSLYGEAGAKIIYSRIFNDCMQHSISCLAVSYADFIKQPRESLEHIIDYCGLDFLSDNINAARSFVRRPSS